MSLFRVLKILIVVIICIAVTGSIVFATVDPTQWTVAFRSGAGGTFGTVATICIARNFIFGDEEDADE